MVDPTGHAHPGTAAAESSIYATAASARTGHVQRTPAASAPARAATAATMSAALTPSETPAAPAPEGAWEMARPAEPPATLPPWRQVLRMPDALPMSAGGTAASAAAAMLGM